MRWLLLALVAGCTSVNPHFHKADLGTTEGPHVDASLSDGSMHATMDAAPDAAAASTCTDGTRECSATGSQVCTDGTYTADRSCPQGSACAAGYCAPPAGAHSCTVDGFTSEGLCNATSTGGMGPSGTPNLACQPFVGSGTVVWDCAPAIGSGAAGKPCDSGLECRSGICADHTCFRVCAGGGDCPQGTQCVDLSFVIEGVTVSTLGCVPQT